jgi:hypothetical protein
MPASKRYPGRRVGYSRLSKSYRARIDRTVGREAWEAGADLRVARGHVPKPPTTAAPVEVVERIVGGQGTDEDFREIGLWNRPGWIPKTMREDVAGALSLLPSPSRWSRVKFYAAPDGEPWRMVVEMKGNAYPVEIEIPGGGAVGTGARDVLELLTDPKLAGADMRYWRSWVSADELSAEGLFDVVGST